MQKYLTSHIWSESKVCLANKSFDVRPTNACIFVIFIFPHLYFTVQPESQYSSNNLLKMFPHKNNAF